ncbi:hypothetical protein BMMGA3_01890 [Bacillus methanolicus MGA3]|uniref:Resolvase/invertase-type recombinase catalytic domain-containing protein n=1 Tax=Bacillus methanolicus (strain MGA3 / ATCC 53907) TaxID=796606 RepID=A0A068LPK6_BACMM|nr:recombinase family protein [Bacillus methanolicus]AIE58848.1 hypothetical protein BMMGA3_01890 [Bacillus methanolicus MGA3]
MKCAIYARVSTRKEEQQNSLQNQISLAESIAHEKGFTVIERYIDNGISGAGIKNRTGLNKLLQDLEKKDIDVVIAKSYQGWEETLYKVYRLLNRLRDKMSA